MRSFDSLLRIAAAQGSSEIKVCRCGKPISANKQLCAACAGEIKKMESEEVNQQEEKKFKVITIQMDDAGSINLASNVSNMVEAFGMLECARISFANKMQRPAVQAPPQAIIVPRPHIDLRTR